MPSKKNQNQLEELKTAIKDSKAVIITDYAGLPVSLQNQLRKSANEIGGSFGVAKNTLLAIALKDRVQELTPQAKTALQGPTAILLTPSDDPVTTTKILYKFIKDNELPTVKLGILDDRILSPDEVEALSKLPGREELLGQLVGQLNAPISGFAQVLRANLQNLVYALNAIKTQKA